MVEDYDTVTTSSKEVIRCVHELRRKVLDEGHDFRKLKVEVNASKVSNQDLMNHETLQLIRERFLSGSTPGHRSKHDNAKLALCLEGGGMRGMCFVVCLSSSVPTAFGTWRPGLYLKLSSLNLLLQTTQAQFPLEWHSLLDALG